MQSELEDIKTHANVKTQPLSDDFKWNLENSPLEISLQAKKIPDWKAVNGLAYLPVSGRDGVYKGNVSDKVEQITLAPIGFTKLRIVAFPVVR